MNTKELRVEMLKHEDTGAMLAAFLGITNPTFSNKINGKGAEFTQSEILQISRRYSLTPERIAEIFFAKNMS